MASMARSGETLLLKILNIHNNVKVVHNLFEKERQLDCIAFEKLKKYKGLTVDPTDPVFKHYSLKNNDILLLKQGTWQHQYIFKGFVLCRNPVSVFSSLKEYDSNEKGYNKNTNFWFNNNERLIRWSNDMDKKLNSHLYNKSPLNQFCLFYNYRMEHLFNLNLPIIRFEDFIIDPHSNLQKICDILNINFNDQMLQFDKFYKKGSMGHGQNTLSSPINTEVLNKYKKNINQKEFEYIKDNTRSIICKYGYTLKNMEIQLYCTCLLF
jgi:hypothetical protein